MSGTTKRGGPRAGSGAPLGNRNAFKHGAYSRQYRLLVNLVAQLVTHIPALYAPVLAELLEHADRGLHCAQHHSQAPQQPAGEPPHTHDTHGRERTDSGVS